MNLLLNILGLILLLIGGVIALVIKEPLPATAVVTEGDDINKAINQTYKTKKWKWTNKNVKRVKKFVIVLLIMGTLLQVISLLPSTWSHAIIDLLSNTFAEKAVSNNTSLKSMKQIITLKA